MASLITLMESFDVNSEEFEAFVDDLMLNNNDIPFDSQEVRNNYFYYLLLNVNVLCSTIVQYFRFIQYMILS